MHNRDDITEQKVVKGQRASEIDFERVEVVQAHTCTECPYIISRCNIQSWRAETLGAAGDFKHWLRNHF